MTEAAGSPNPVDRVVGALEANGRRVRRQARGWMAQCPAHEDSDPSLKIDESENGSALVCCHAGCTTAQVCEALGLHLADLFPPKPPKVAYIGPSGRFKASYTYTDEDGEALFRVVRYEPKTFRQQRPDGKDGWINGVEGIRKVPYHLPQLRKAIADGKTIWVCEGEKDAENAEWFVHGHIVATCNAMGAGKWTDEHARYLYGASKVVIVADNDRPGHDHARHVAKTLVDHVDRVIVVLPAIGKDLTEHFHAQKDIADFVTVWDTLSPSEWLAGDGGADEELDGLPTPIDWAIFWKRESSQEWLIEPLIPVGRHVVLYAPAKEGKSLLALEVAAAAASGRAVLGHPKGDPLRVVYLDFEMTEDDLQERLIDMGYDEDADLSNLFYYSLPDLPPLDTPAGGAAVEAIVRRHDAQLIVIDTMARVVQGEENSADTYRWFDMYTSLRMKTLRVAVLRLDHAGKDVGKGQRGSSEKVGYADVVWQLRFDRDTGAATLKATHKRLGWVPDLVTLARVEEPSLAHLVQIDASAIDNAEVLEVVALLDELQVPLDAKSTEAIETLKAASRGRRRQLVLAALKRRKKAGNHAGTEVPGTDSGTDADGREQSVSDQPGTMREPSGTESSHRSGTPRISLICGGSDVPGPDDPDPYDNKLV